MKLDYFEALNHQTASCSVWLKGISNSTFFYLLLSIKSFSCIRGDFCFCWWCPLHCVKLPCTMEGPHISHKTLGYFYFPEKMFMIPNCQQSMMWWYVLCSSEILHCNTLPVTVLPLPLSVPAHAPLQSSVDAICTASLLPQQQCSCGKQGWGKRDTKESRAARSHRC